MLWFCIPEVPGELVPVRCKQWATYRMVVCGDTAGTVSRFRCIHLTVVRKHKQRLGQARANRGPPPASNNRATTASRHGGETKCPARSAIASEQRSRAQSAAAATHCELNSEEERHRAWEGECARRGEKEGRRGERQADNPHKSRKTLTLCGAKFKCYCRPCVRSGCAPLTKEESSVRIHLL